MTTPTPGKIGHPLDAERTRDWIVGLAILYALGYLLSTLTIWFTKCNPPQNLTHSKVEALP
jgi:ABC-type uncharacterized transport system permease subunit